jgi:hypothetical protein
MQGVFNITDEGGIKEYLGVLVEKQDDGTFQLSQPQLIKQILDDLWFNKRTKSKPTPALGGQVLERENDAEPMNDDFHYRSVIGKANFLEKSTRPDIAVAVHQCARFSWCWFLERALAMRMEMSRRWLSSCRLRPTSKVLCYSTNLRYDIIASFGWFLGAIPMKRSALRTIQRMLKLGYIVRRGANCVRYSVARNMAHPDSKFNAKEKSSYSQQLIDTRGDRTSKRSLEGLCFSEPQGWYDYLLHGARLPSLSLRMLALLSRGICKPDH